MASPTVLFLDKTNFLSWICCGVIFLMLSSVWADDFCKAIKGPTGQKKIPDLDVTAYAMMSRATLVEGSYTVFAEEFYDSNKNFIRFNIVHRGLQRGLVVDYDNNSYVIYDQKDADLRNADCKIEYADQAPQSDLFMLGAAPVSDDGAKILSFPDYINAVKDSDYVYVGEQDINGIQVDHWQSCQKWLGAVFLLDIYFTTADFKPLDSKTPTQVPVRLVLEGEQYTTKFNHIHDYFNFEAKDELPQSVFSLPDFVECRGRTDTVWSKNVPSLPESMSYTVEKVVSTPQQGKDPKVSVNVQTVYHDVKRRLVRVDSDKTTSISDFNIGVELFIDDSGCTQRAIDPQNVPSSYKQNDVIMMGDNPEIAYLRKHDFYYSGTRSFRGSSTDGFARDTATENIQVFFTKEENTPLGVEVKKLSNDELTIYNIFNFVSFSYPPDTHPFDPRGCESGEDSYYSKKIRKDIRIKLLLGSGYSDASDTLPYMAQISEQFRDLIAEKFEISVLQIVPYDYITMDKAVYLYVSLIGLDATKPQAKVNDPKSIEYAFHIYENLKSATLYSLISFTFNGGRQATWEFWMTDVSEDDSLFKSGSNTDLSHYFNKREDRCSVKFESFQTSQERNVNDCAQKCLDLACRKFQYKAKTKACELSYDTKAQDEYMPDCNSYDRFYFTDFDFISGSETLLRKADAEHKTDSGNDCAKLCEEEKKYDCKSFDYCPNSGQCSLHSVSSYSDEVVMKDTEYDGESVVFDHCQHYTRTPLNNYNYEGTLDVISPGTVLITADSHMICAQACLEYGGVGCSMFAFCNSDSSASTDGNCKLVTASDEKTVALTTSESCALYKRKGLVSGSSGNSGFTQQQQQAGPSYSGGTLFFLGVAMVTTGVGVGVLTVFLLSWFNVWKGF